MTTESILKRFGGKPLYLKQKETNSLVGNAVEVPESVVRLPSTSAVAFQVCLRSPGV